MAASFFTSFHPSLDLVAGDISAASLDSALDIVFWTVVVLGPPTVMMGYAFPNLIREASGDLSVLGQSVSRVYFANLVGSVLGSLATGFVAVHYLGTEHALRLLIVAGCATAAGALIEAQRARPAGSLASSRRAIAGAALVALAAIVVFPGRTQLIRALHFASADAVEFVGAEDRSGVAVLRRQTAIVAFDLERRILGEQRLYIDGSTHGATSGDTYAPDEVAPIVLAAHRNPRRVLLIGLGDGEMAASAVAAPEVEEVIIVELNGALPTVLRTTRKGAAILDSPKVRLVIDDGRRWLLANPTARFDVVMMWPLHAAHAYSGALYSREFFGVIASRLDPGGTLLVKSADAFSTARTIATVFAYTLRVDAQGYVASNAPLRFDPHRLPDGTEATMRRLTADRALIIASTRHARINTDLRPNSEFFITYPYAWSLRPSMAQSELFRIVDSSSFAALFTPGGTPAAR